MFEKNEKQSQISQKLSEIKQKTHSFYFKKCDYENPVIIYENKK